MSSSGAKRFWVGFSAALVVAAGANLFPYWRTYGAAGTDGVEVIGFPLTFRRLGGFVPVYEFHAGALLIDLGLAVGFALAVGWAVMKLTASLSRGSGTGFPVVPNRDEPGRGEA